MHHSASKSTRYVVHADQSNVMHYMGSCVTGSDTTKYNGCHIFYITSRRITCWKVLINGLAYSAQNIFHWILLQKQPQGLTNTWHIMINIIWVPNQYSIFILHNFNVKLLGKYAQTPVWQLCDSCQMFHLIDFQNNLTWPNSNTPEIRLDSRLKYNKMNHRYAKKNSPFTWLLYWKLSIDTDFIHFICQFHVSCGMHAR